MLRNGGLLLEKRISYFDGKYSNPIRSFSAKELEKATDNYSENVTFYRGCTPWVYFDWYKGCLEGRAIFVKRYIDKSGLFKNHEGEANEISVAAQVSGHKNALKLLGCCLETQFHTLVFEFPMNGNLHHQLTFNPTCLSWKSRLKIANEIASVITYLHTAFPRPIIHRDIQAEHFHLDQDLCAKLSDFLFCMPLPEGKTRIETGDASGERFGAPEVSSRGVYSDQKSDVFEFGLLLFNLLKGKAYLGRTSSITDSSNHGINEIADPTLLAEGEGIHHHRHFRAVYQLILKCCRPNAEERPIMLDVAKQLRRIQRGDFISDGAIATICTDTFSSYNIGLTRLSWHRRALK